MPRSGQWVVYVAFDGATEPLAHCREFDIYGPFESESEAQALINRYKGVVEEYGQLAWAVELNTPRQFELDHSCWSS